MAEYRLRTLDKDRKPSETLDGEFRVFFHPNELKSLGLQAGDYCLLTANSGASGVGIAWPGDGKSGHQILKISQFLKNAYGFTLDDRYSVARENEENLLLVQEIWLREQSDSNGIHMDSLKSSVATALRKSQNLRIPVHAVPNTCRKLRSNLD